MTGKKFEGRDYTDVLDVIEKNIADAIASL
jgi:hypothetical protein